MSNLKDIMLELHNCLHEFEPEDEIPMVWSREFQQKLAQNATQWNDDQRRASHVSNMDFQDEEDADIGVPYGNDDGYDAAGGGSEMRDTELDIGATLDVDYRPPGVETQPEKDFATKYGEAYRMWKTGNPEGNVDAEGLGNERFSSIAGLLGMGVEEEEEDYSSEKYHCKDCSGTGHERRMKRDCPTCDGTGKNDDYWADAGMGFDHPSDMEEEEEDTNSVKGVKIGGNLNITDDPEKVARAKKLRDRARVVRDEAKEKREEAKAQKDGERTEDSALDGEEGEDGEWENDDLQGTIRTVPNAHLVYKRQQEDGTFDELWHYNIGDDFKKELKIRRAVLAGTDIPINKMQSPDGSQTYELWTVGNGQMLKVQGLPN